MNNNSKLKTIAATAVAVAGATVGTMYFKAGPASATASLTSAADYRYTTPNVPSHINGAVMGKELRYRVLRSEDIAFLHEAYTELDSIWWIHQSIEGYLPLDGIDSLPLKEIEFGYETVFSSPINCFTNVVYGYTWPLVDGDVNILDSVGEYTNHLQGSSLKSVVTDRDSSDEYKLSKAGVDLLSNYYPVRQAIVANYNAVAEAHKIKHCAVDATEYMMTYCSNHYDRIIVDFDIAGGIWPPQWTTTPFSGDDSYESYRLRHVVYYRSRTDLTESAAAGKYRQTTSDPYEYSSYGPYKGYHQFEEEYTKTNRIVVNTDCYITNNLYANFNHIASMSAIGVFYITDCDGSDYRSYYYSGGTQHWTTVDPRYTRKTLLVEMNAQLVENHDREKYDIVVTISDTKALMQSIYPAGIYSILDGFVAIPSTPSLDDMPNPLSYNGYSNENMGYKEFEIYLDSIYFELTFRYRTTFSDE